MKLVDHFKIRFVLIGFVTVNLANISLSSAAIFQGLGDLQGGNFYSEANAVSADGLVVVGSSHSVLGHEAFRWEFGVMMGLGDLSGGTFSSWAYGVSANGSVVVGQGQPSSGCEAFRWTQQGGMQGIGHLPYGDEFISRAFAVCEDGTVVVGYSDCGSNGSTDYEAFRWTTLEGMQGLGSLESDGTNNSYAYDVSADGSVVVGYCYHKYVSEEYNEAFRWTVANGMIGLGGGRAYAVSKNGAIVIGVSAGNNVFRWTEATSMVDLGYSGTVEDISANGSAIVGESFTPTGDEAYIWDEANGLRNLKEVLVNELGLDLDGWTLQNATGISDDGMTIVGYGTNPSGDTEGWIAIVPEFGVDNDECIDAIPVTLDVVYNGSNRYATGTDTSSCSYNDTIDAWHSFTPDLNGDYTFSLCGSNFDTTLAVYEQCGGNELACNDDTAFGVCSTKFQSQLSINLLSDATYYIRISGYDGQSGDYSLLVTGANLTEPIADECVNAIPVVLNTPYGASTKDATGTTTSSCSYNDTIDVWHSFTAGLIGDYTFSLCGSNFDTTIAIYEQCGGAELACNDDTEPGVCPSKMQSQVSIPLSEGTTCFIRISGYDGQTGDYTLTVTGPDCTEPLEGDLNNDCKVDLRDFAKLAANWLKCNISPPDSCWR